MLYLLPILFFPFISFLSLATNHSIGPIVVYQLNQKNIPGFGLTYNYKINNFLELDTGVIHNSDIEIIKNTSTFIGQYDNLFLGFNFNNHYNDHLSIKAGFGASYVIDSSNDSLIKTNQTAAYLKLSANYRINKNFIVEFGQTNQFNNGMLGTNHSLYFGIGWLFGNDNNSTISTFGNKIITDEDVLATQQHIKVNPDVVNDKVSDNLPSPIPDTNDIDIVETTLSSFTWFIQLGAYKNEINANYALAELIQKLPTNNASYQFQVVYHNNLYKLVSVTAYKTKILANTVQHLIETNFNLKGFISHLNIN